MRISTNLFLYSWFSLTHWSYVSSGCSFMSVKCVQGPGWGLVSHIALLIPAWSPFRRRANVLFQPVRDAQVQIASLYRLLTDGVNTAQTTTNQAGYYVYRSLSKLQKVLYFSNIWGVKESVSRRGRILNKQKQWDKRKKRVKKRQRCWGRLGRCGRFQTPNLRETARQSERESERAQIISANTNMVNGSKLEFTRVGCSARAAQKIVSLNQADLNGNREEEDANSCFSQ